MLHQPAKAVATLRQHQRQPAHLGQRYLGPPRRTGRADQAQLLPQHRLLFQVGLRLGVVDQPQVHPAGGQPFGDVRRKAFDDGHAGLGHLGLEALDQRHRDVPRQAGRQAQHDLPLRFAAHRAQLMLGGLHQLQDLPPAVQQAAARLGEHHAAAVAQQQGFAQLHLQRAHLAAQGGLRHAQQFGRAAEAARLRHLDEVFDLLDVHRPIVPRPRPAMPNRHSS